MKNYNHRDPVTPALFENPTSEYRAAPFWAWNGKLEPDILRAQIDCFKEMGFGGFHMHPRVGLATEYLGGEYMDCVRACTDKARKESMLAWLYDEDKWPSGFAGGIVTKEERYRARYLLFTPVSYEEQAGKGSTDISGAHAARSGNGRLIARYDVQLSDAGELTAYRRLGEGEQAQGALWFAYLETPAPNPWFNDQTYVNTLDKAAIDRFIEVTHEAYARAVGSDFASVIPAIFTDEPQFSRKTTLGFAHERADVILPWTDDLPDTCRAVCGEELLARLPELVWELPAGKISSARYHYHDHVAERFAQAFADSCGAWCRAHGIMLTGHMMEEPTLESQTQALGDAMRSYRAFDLPGIDMLCDRYEFTTAKQAQSAAHQFGCVGTLSELYGVTNWDFDFRGHKLQGDWQAALGVCQRVPHLSWMTMAGEAKRDYPASISYQSPWYKKYKLVEDHFARVNTALTRGAPVVRVGVVHPVESYWLHFGPREQTAAVRDQMDERFQSLAQWLLLGAVDFDYISESLLPDQCPEGGAPLCVGKMRYDTLIVPACETIRRTTLERLLAFGRAGGKLLLLGDAPAYIDAVLSAEGAQLLDYAAALPYEQAALLGALEDVRAVSLRGADGKRTDNLITQLRRDGEDCWLFVAQGVRPRDREVSRAQEVELAVRGAYRVQVYDTMSGSIRPLAARVQGGWTRFPYTLYQHDSLLLRLTPSTETGSGSTAARTREASVEQTIPSLNPVTLHEPNVLLLDRACFSLDEEDYSTEPMELLRADNVLRRRLGWPPRQDAVAQPWTVPQEVPAHCCRLRFEFDSEVAVSGAKLAIEDAQSVTVLLDGKSVASKPDGWYVDYAIGTLPLPAIEPGLHVLEVSIPFGRRTNVEWCYLLGDFGVRVQGCARTLTAPVRALGFGDVTAQGLPYYGGNITYRIPLTCAAGELTIHAPHYKGALIAAALDGADCGNILFAPYDCTAPVQAGAHTLELTLYGNRHNTFGALHNANPEEAWAGPNLWRSQDDSWSEEHCLRPVGILSSPVVTVR